MNKCSVNNKLVHDYCKNVSWKIYVVGRLTFNDAILTKSISEIGFMLLIIFLSDKIKEIIDAMLFKCVYYFSF